VDDKPRYYRGETGAQDSIVPSTDTLMGMPYPENKLTEYLMDLRAYRPMDHRAYLKWLKEATEHYKV
jgi:indoleamine 2,3-dioxygenase